MKAYMLLKTFIFRKGVKSMWKMNKAFIAVSIICIIIVSFVYIRGYNYYRYKYVLDDINALIEAADINPAVQDSFIEGDQVSTPHKVVVNTKESLQAVSIIVKEIIKSNRHEKIMADGEITYIYFGDYVIMHQGGATLIKIGQNEEMTTIKSCMPAGNVISGKIHELKNKVRGSNQ